jgi:hypothetical protein
MPPRNRNRGSKRQSATTAEPSGCAGEETDEIESGSRPPKRAGTSTSPSGLDLVTEVHGQGGDGVSSLREGSVQNTEMEEKWRMIEVRVKSMEERQGGVTVVSAGATMETTPENEMILKENLRKFVTSKVFPSWKFIFKKELLEKCVVAAVSKSYITVPPGFDQIQLAERYSQTVRACLDCCRANAQTAARKRYLGT